MIALLNTIGIIFVVLMLIGLIAFIDEVCPKHKREQLWYSFRHNFITLCMYIALISVIIILLPTAGLTRLAKWLTERCTKQKGRP